MNKRVVIFIVRIILALVIVFPVTPATAANLTVQPAGRITIELITSDAAFSNTLSIISPTASIAATGCKLEPSVGLTGLRVLSEKLSQRGCRVDLDADPATAGIQGFAANTAFEFNMCAQTDADPDCEFIWSSNPGNNSDNFDHVQTTTLAPGVYQLAWEDLENGGDMDFNDLIVVVRVQADSDGDGLWDDWEQSGIDTNGDGIVDYDLPALGANPNRKDIFLEIDFMDCAAAGGDCAAGDTHSHRPQTAAVDAVIAAFANAPVTNPDGSMGITLHIEVDDTISHQNFLSLGCGFGTTFDAVKADPANFGPNNPRRFTHHYAIFAHQQASTTTSSGCGELPGNDFIVTLGGWTETAQQQAGTLMHEFGHTLNLRHGGGDNTNRKPNYLSIMNYEFQTRGIAPTDPDGTGPLTARVDFSRADLPDLNENSLNEPAGIGDGTDNTRRYCPDGTSNVGAGTGAIDWNCDNDGGTDTSVAVNVNGDGVTGTLAGWDDWQNLRYTFQNTPDFEDGVHETTVDLVEIDYPTHLEIPINVEIDIEPKGDVNPINCGNGNGVIPVAILTTDNFDALSVDHTTVSFMGAGEAHLVNKNGIPRQHEEDVDHDGDIDLLFHFRLQDTSLTCESTEGTLTGVSFDGSLIIGTDNILMVPIRNKK
jgi:hypothetical protein